jgi:hypothetical protein
MSIIIIIIIITRRRRRRHGGGGGLSPSRWIPERAPRPSSLLRHRVSSFTQFTHSRRLYRRRRRHSSHTKQHTKIARATIYLPTLEGCARPLDSMTITLLCILPADDDVFQTLTRPGCYPWSHERSFCLD